MSGLCPLAAAIRSGFEIPDMTKRSQDFVRFRVAWPAAEKVFADGKGANLECADNGGALGFLASASAKSKAALRLPPHSKFIFQQPARFLRSPARARDW
jgi:hypothetical protein